MYLNPQVQSVLPMWGVAVGLCTKVWRTNQPVLILLQKSDCLAPSQLPKAAYLEEGPQESLSNPCWNFQLAWSYADNSSSCKFMCAIARPCPECFSRQNVSLNVELIHWLGWPSSGLPPSQQWRYDCISVPAFIWTLVSELRPSNVCRKHFASWTNLLHFYALTGVKFLYFAKLS